MSTSLDLDTAITAGKAVSYTGAGTAVVRGLTLSEWGVVIGIACWLVGTALTAVCSWRKDKREQVLLVARTRRAIEAAKAAPATAGAIGKGEI